MPLFEGQGTLYWSLLSQDAANTTSVLSAALVFPISQGYFGIGLPNNVLPGQGHINTDMIVAVIGDNRGVTLGDRYSTAEAFPSLDTSLGGVDSLMVPQGIVTPDGQLFVKFRRLYQTGDVYDNDISVTTVQPCQFAFSNASGLQYHGRGNVETVVCNFGNITERTASPSNPNPYSLVVAHAVLGAFGIGLFLTFGGFFYRYLWCLPVRVRTLFSGVLFVFGAVLTLISFIIAGVMVSQGSGDHYSFNSGSNGAHSILSLVAMIAVFAFIVLRFLADCALKPSRIEVAEDRNSEKAQFYRLGSFAGWAALVIVLLVGWPAIFLGFVDNYTTFPWLWVIGAILIFIGVVFIVAEIIRCFKGPKDELDEDDLDMVERRRAAAAARHDAPVVPAQPVVVAE
jgi:hypothetical protein